MVLDGLVLGDDPATWEALGFTVDGDVARVGGVGLRLAGGRAGTGILGWRVAGLEGAVLPVGEAVDPGADVHPNGVSAVDHVVALAGDLDGALAAFAASGLEPRRIRDAGRGRRQAFYVLGTALLELVGPVEGEAAPRLWGLTLVADDLDGLASQLGNRLGPVRPAVQPGRRIATLRREAGSSVPMAFITPRPGSG